jgi:hypothetical protein
MDETELLKHHKILDDILVFVSESDRDFEHFGEIRKQLGFSASDDLTLSLLNFMVAKGVVDPIEHSGFRVGEDFKLIAKNTKTSLFIENGGFNRLNTQLQNERKRLSDNQKIEDAKLRWDARLSKWQVCTFWPVFIGGFIGGIFGTASLVLELEDRGYLTLPIELRKSQTEQIEVSTNSNDTTKQAVQYSSADTLK